MYSYLTLHQPTLARRYYDAGLWSHDTFYSLLADRSKKTPDRDALVDGNVQVTWGEMQKRVDALADDLVNIGLVPGDRVCVWLSNRVEAVVTFLACNREGFACNPSLHKTFTSAEVLALIERLQARVLVTEPGWGADRCDREFVHALEQIPSLKRVYQIDDLSSGVHALERRAFHDPDAVAYLAFTSGTTGRPKCVMHSSNTILANARDLVRDWRIGADETILTLSPLSHHIAWVAVAQWLLSGCRLVTNNPPYGQDALDWILGTNATYVMGVPTHAIDIIAKMRKRGLAKLGAVHTFYLAGAPIPASVATHFVTMGIRPQNIYGMTENSSHQYTHPEDGPDTAVNTCGRGGRAYEVAVFSTEDVNEKVASGEVGQVGGNGAALMLGYFDDHMATEQSFNAHGFFLSGDLGSLDDAGNLRIVGRMKDLIIRGGHNIYPSNIEAYALTHPQVHKAAVFGLPDDRLGERICLAIEGEVGGEVLLKHMASKGLSKFEMPEWFVVLQDFPLTASGKVLKRKILQQIQEDIIQPLEILNTKYLGESVHER